MGGIRGKTAKDCFDQFTVHLNPLLRATISKTAQVRISQLDEKGVLGWADDEFLPLATRHRRRSEPDPLAAVRGSNPVDVHRVSLREALGSRV
jgi:hypothetical protein